ncbi:lysine-N-methylase [Clostridium diolis]|uniref:flagellin lysine-N-methylase n=1 Tax=Clostridium diolis TaxID=223919 RepID=UPI000B3FA0D2|nr:flagellin lysine-N-methylase [Clostridium diolis]OVE64828.1 lysine-N-methylase [Clostridium diolis]
MKINVFLPKYMEKFKCINSSCIDTCCAGWDINIDEDTYNNYTNSTGEFKELLEGKFFLNEAEHDFFNNGFMALKDGNRCPFLNCNMLCDIHGGFGEKNLCITCKSYPRVFNIVDNIYEKSGLPSCIEICTKAFLDKDKMEFIESEEEIHENDIEIRRIIDSEAFEGTESLFQYFWDIRVISINIIQLREYSIEERLNILKNFYWKIQSSYKLNDFDGIEKLLDDFNNEYIDYESLKGMNFKENNDFYMDIAKDDLLENIRGIRLKQCVNEYKDGIFNKNDLRTYLEENPRYFDEIDEYSYILENYLVNQIFKDLIPFNKGEEFLESIKVLINTYKIIKAYIIGIAMNSKEKINEQQIIRVIQSLSKDIEHNKVFKELLER